MEHTHRHRASTWRVSVGRLAAVALAVGGLSAAAFVPSALAATSASEISTAKDAKLGTVLVSDGNTVYTVKPSKTACTDKCLKSWAPVVLPTGVTGATAGTGVDASKLGTMTAADGTLQVTYAGKGLFYSTKTKAPAQVKDTWGKWSAVITKPSASSGDNGDKNAGTGGVSF